MTFLVSHLLDLAGRALKAWRGVRSFAAEVAALRRDLRHRFPGSVD